MKLCQHCIQEMQNSGKLVVYDHVDYIPVKEVETASTPCEWCYEFDDLYICQVFDD